MKLGQNLPQIQDFAELYPRSQALQDCLLEYYILVVELCREVLRLSNQNRVAQIFTNIMQTLDTFKDRLEERSKAVRNQVQLETARMAQREAEKNARFWDLAGRHMSLQKADHQQRYKRQILHACSDFNYQTYWKQIKKAGSTSLFHEVPGYQSWKKSQQASWLLYSGKLGSGKSVLLANMVDDLFLQNKSIVTYFFCNFDVNESLECRTILGCLARQLLEHVPDSEHLEDIVGDRPSWLDTDQLVAVIKHCVSRPTHFVLDGLDECNQAQRTEIIKTLQTLQDEVPLSVCLATRFQGKQMISIQDKRNVVTYEEKFPEKNPDIEAYIEYEVNERINTEQLAVNGDDLVEEIKEKLWEGSEGMFLWVYLQIVSLCSMESNHAIRQALQDLPKGLSETYARLLAGSAISRYRKALFELVTVAVRPLNVTELCDALSVEPGNTIYNPEKLLNGIVPVLRSCGGLVIVDEEEETVRFVHSSAGRFLTTQAVDCVEEGEANLNASRTILTYLNYSIFDTMIARKAKVALPLETLPSTMLRERTPISNKFGTPHWKAELSRHLVNDAWSRFETIYHFMMYAKEHCLQHLMRSEFDSLMPNLFRSAIAKGRLNPSINDYDYHPLLRAVEADNPQLITLLLECHMDQGIIERSIRLASTLNRTTSLDVLLPNYDRTLDLWILAVSEDCPVLLAALLRQDHINPNLPVLSTGYTPLLLAIREGKLDLVKLLLANPRVDLQQRFMSPVQLAVETGSMDILTVLLHKNLPVHREDRGFSLWNAIFDSVHPIVIEMAHILLTAGVLLPNEIFLSLPLLMATVRYARYYTRDDLLRLLLMQPGCKVNELHDEELDTHVVRVTVLDIVQNLSRKEALYERTTDILKEFGALTAREVIGRGGL